MPEPIDVLYTAHATAYGDGRSGHVTSDDDVLDVDLAVPKSMGGPGGDLSNPEQLFAAGYAACFGSAFAHVARTQKITTGPLTITAHVTIGPVGQAYGLAVELVAAVPELPREQAEALLRAAHQVCPYSNATRGNIAVDVRLA
jgi:lipoyl-dependent peroxiredoxin